MLAPWSKIRLLRGAVDNFLKTLLNKLASYYIQSMQNKRMNTQFLFINTIISMLHFNDIFHSLYCMARYNRQASNLVQDISNVKISIKFYG